MKLLYIVLLVVILLLGITAFLALRAVRNLAYNLVHPMRQAATSTPADFGLENWEDVRFAASNLELAGWFIPPTPAADGATLIFVHGWSGNRSALLAQAAMLNKRGYGAFLIDLRNSGESEGTMTTWGFSEVEDVQGAFAYLLTRPEVNSERIGLVGYSTGGATVIRAAARMPEVRVVVAESSYTAFVDNLPTIVDLLGGRLPPSCASLVLWFSELETGVAMREIRPIDDLTQIAPRPIMFLHGAQDEVVDVSHSQRLFVAAAEPKALQVFPNAKHEDIFSVDPAEFEQQVGSFLDAHLREP